MAHVTVCSVIVMHAQPPLIAIMVVISSVRGGYYDVRVIQIINFPLELGEYGTLI